MCEGTTLNMYNYKKTVNIWFYMIIKSWDISFLSGMTMKGNPWSQDIPKVYQDYLQK